MGKKKKERGLFDHLNEIKKSKDPDYWEKLTEKERKAFSTFMIERFLSMNPDWTGLISQLKPLTYQMEDRHVYRLYAEVLPYDSRYYKYISNKNKEEYPDWLVDMLREHFELPKKQVREYINILSSSDEGKKKMRSILRMYAVEDKKLEKIEKL